MEQSGMEPERGSLLIADNIDGQKRFQAILSPLYELSFVASLSSAQNLLQGLSADSKIDGIICSTLFDDSRMLDLLRFTREKTPRLKNVPFLIVEDPSRVLRSGTAWLDSLKHFQGVLVNLDDIHDSDDKIFERLINLLR